MGFFDRLSRLIRSNLNDLLNKAEDPGKILDQSVIDISDETFQKSGNIGLWTKADAVTYFDDLQLAIKK